MGSQSAGTQAALAGGRAIKAHQLSPDHEQGNHYHNIRLLGKGGAIEFKPFESYSVILPYAPNSLGKKGHVVAGLGDFDGPLGGTPTPPPNFTIDWEGQLGLNSPSITFNSDDLTMTISGSGLNPKTSYTLFVYTSVSPSFSWNLVSQTSLGTPVNGTLSTSSLFENGFTDPEGGTLFALEH